MAQLTGAQLFGKQLRRERWLLAADKDREIENQEIAEAVGVDASTVGRWFEGRTMPREETLQKLAAYFKVTPAWLRYAQEPRQAPPTIPKRARGTVNLPADEKRRQG